LLKYDRFLSGALLYRGWGYGGYQLSDKMVLIAGSSLDIGTKSLITTKTHEIARNIRKLSALDMGEEEMKNYVRTITSFKPKFIRGYASSIYFFAKWIEENDIRVHCPSSVFTTAEKLYPHMRKKISDIFCCDVFDEYGLNDGGISSFECSEHTGLHIDTERSILEVIDGKYMQVYSGQGEIIATSLHNYAFPLIRYDTGDVGSLIEDTCSCGRGYRLLKEIIGRENEFLITPSGQYVHGAAFFFDVLNEFSNINDISEYQLVQETVNDICLHLVCKEPFDQKELEKVAELVKKRSGGWNMRFNFVDAIERTDAGKYKFIINKIGSQYCH
jgi:phenylacetate-CoA ligase